MVGDTTGGVLGLGIVISLQDAFSSVARNVERQMRSLGSTANSMIESIDSARKQLNSGLMATAIGVGTLASLNLPVKEAMDFSYQLTRIATIIDNEKFKSFGGIENLNQVTKELASMYLETPTAQAEALYNAIAAGIDDVTTAVTLLHQANKLSVASGADLTVTLDGIRAEAQSFGLGVVYDELKHLDEQTKKTLAARDFKRISDVMFETMKVGSFTVPGRKTPDMQEIARQIGQLAPQASAIGMTLEEMMALWAVNTLGGQPAQRAATGIRQALTDILNPTVKGNKRFVEFINRELGLKLRDPKDYAKAMNDLIRSQGFIRFLELVRKYIITDQKGFEAALKNPEIQRKLRELSDIPDANLDDFTPEVLEFLSNIGAINLSNAKDVFKSIWGLTAMLPVLTVQFNKFSETLEKIKSASAVDATQTAFSRISEEASVQLRILQNRFRLLAITLGTHLLPVVTNVFKAISAAVTAVNDLAERFPTLTKAILYSVVAFGAFMTVIGLAKMATAAFRLMGIVVKASMLSIPRFASIAAIGLARAFWPIALIATGLMFIFNKVKQAFDNKLGLHGAASGLASFGYMIRAVLEGIAAGWKKFWRDFGASMRSLWANHIRPFINRMLAVIPGLKEFGEKLQKALNPNRAGIETLKRIGEGIGRMAAAITTAIPLLIALAGAFIALINPMRLALAIFIGVGMYLYNNWPKIIKAAGNVAARVANYIIGHINGIIGAVERLINLLPFLEVRLKRIGNVGVSTPREFLPGTGPAAINLPNKMGFFNNFTTPTFKGVPYALPASPSGVLASPGLPVTPGLLAPPKPGMAPGNASLLAPVNQQALLDQYAAAYKSPSSRGGSAVTREELSDLRRIMEAALNRPVELTVTVDGRVLFKAVQNQQNLQRRIGGSR